MKGFEKSTRRGGVAPLSKAVTDFLKASGLDIKIKDGRVYEAWREAVGSEIYGETMPVDFARGELVVEVESAAQRHELKGFTGENYRRAANSILGTERIRKVVFKLKT